MNIFHAIANEYGNVRNALVNYFNPPAQPAPRVIFNSERYNQDLRNKPMPPATQPAPVPITTPPLAQPSTPIDPHFQNYLSNVAKMSKITPKPLAVPADLKTAIGTASAKYGVPTSVLSAIAHQETGFQNIPEHGGGFGRGYFQIDLGQHPDVSQSQAMDPNFAADYAAKLLMSRMDTYSGTKTPVVNAIRAYNGGLTNPRTKTYSDSVLNKLQQYTFQ